MKNINFRATVTDKYNTIQGNTWKVMKTKCFKTKDDPFIVNESESDHKIPLGVQ